MKEEADEYVVKACAFCDLGEADRTRCLRLIGGGGAVDIETATRDFPLSLVIGIARKDREIVGVGVIKPVRKPYAARTAVKAKYPFEAVPELGYVVVDQNHRGKHVSSRIAKVLSEYPGPLFATTSADAMKSTLKHVGFEQHGGEWEGKRGDMISLWIRS
jgi:hypothetical protein